MPLPWKRLSGALLALAMLGSLAGCGWGGDPRDFTLTVTPTDVNVVADYTTGAYNVSINSMWGFAQPVYVTATPPAGLTCVYSCTIDITNGGSFRFDTVQTLQAGTYTIAFHAASSFTAFDGTSTSRNHDITALVDVAAWDGTTPPPDFDFTVDPQLTYFSPPKPGLPSKGTVQYNFTFYRYNHYTGPIQVSFDPNPDLTCIPNTCSAATYGDMANALFTVENPGSPGVYIPAFTASVLPYVTRHATARIIVYTPPPIPSPPGG